MSAGADFADPFNPTAAEIRRWAFRPGVYFPMEDWDLVVIADEAKFPLFLELAADPGCPGRLTFLGILYLVVGDAVRNGWDARAHAPVQALIRAGGASADAGVRLWASRAVALIADTGSFDYSDWCQGGLVGKG